MKNISIASREVSSWIISIYSVLMSELYALSKN